MILPTIKNENNRKIKFFQKGEIQGQFNKKKDLIPLKTFNIFDLKYQELLKE